MAGHVDILDEKEPLGRFFASSVILHVTIAGSLIAYGVVRSGPHFQIGDKNGGGMGSVAVTPTSTIPLMQRNAPTNPVANPTESALPTPPPEHKVKAAPKPKVVAPPPDAIKLADKNARTKSRPQQVATNTFREKQTFAPNQVYSNVGQALSSPMYAKQGAGGVGIGNSSPFGQQFGWYADTLQRIIANKWQTSGVDGRYSTAPQVSVFFTIRKDGSLAPGSLKVIQSSGIMSLDLSAQHAILDAAPSFPPLPPGFPKNDADVEMRFELRR